MNFDMLLAGAIVLAALWALYGLALAIRLIWRRLREKARTIGSPVSSDHVPGQTETLGL